MNKTEFKEQFKRLRVAGYRLPVWDDVKVDEVMAEWYATFGNCSVEEFSSAIDTLKQVKTDTFWPATGEIWTHVLRYRKERRIRLQAQSGGEYHYPELSSSQRKEMAGMFREFAQKLGQRMTMPKVESADQVEPDHVIRQHEEDDRITAEETGS